MLIEAPQYFYIIAYLYLFEYMINVYCPGVGADQSLGSKCSHDLYKLCKGFMPSQSGSGEDVSRFLLFIVMAAFLVM